MVYVTTDRLHSLVLDVQTRCGGETQHYTVVLVVMNSFVKRSLSVIVKKARCGAQQDAYPCRSNQMLCNIVSCCKMLWLAVLVLTLLEQGVVTSYDALPFTSFSWSALMFQIAGISCRNQL